MSFTNFNLLHKNKFKSAEVSKNLRRDIVVATLVAYDYDAEWDKRFSWLRPWLTALQIFDHARRRL